MDSVSSSMNERALYSVPIEIVRYWPKDRIFDEQQNAMDIVSGKTLGIQIHVPLVYTVVIALEEGSQSRMLRSSLSVWVRMRYKE